MERDEVVIDVEAAVAVYGDDCVVLDEYPPRLRVHIRPRTADVSSQQFVEAVIGIHASVKYPDEPPDISIIDSKGLDEQREKYLITSIRDKARELSSNLMLVALCEEAVERLSNMNHPDGNCPLCLTPLLDEDAGNNALPFMKLMSCFHCFHCKCIIRWWNWLHMQKEIDDASSSGPILQPRCSGHQKDIHRELEERNGICPVCRKVFQAKDIEHVLDLVGAYSQLALDDTEAGEDEKLLESDSEKIRRQKFEATLKLQQANNGLIEPKKSEVLLPGMFLPQPITTTPAVPDKESETNTSQNVTSNGSSSRLGGSERRGSGPRRKYRGRNPRSQVKQWTKKENGTAE